MQYAKILDMTLGEDDVDVDSATLGIRNKFRDAEGVTGLWAEARDDDGMGAADPDARREALLVARSRPSAKTSSSPTKGCPRAVAGGARLGPACAPLALGCGEPR